LTNCVDRIETLKDTGVDTTAAELWVTPAIEELFA